MTAPTPDTTIVTEVPLRLVLGGDRALLVPAVFGYDPREPFAISATFVTTDGEVRWIFARELLDEGLRRPTGHGDVAVWPSRTRGLEVVCVALSSPSGQALLEADRAVLADFLAATYASVPEGAESAQLDIDMELAALLRSEGGSAGV